MWITTAISFLKNNLSFLVAFVLLTLLGLMYVNTLKLESQLAGSELTQQTLKADLEATQHNSNELQSALLTEQLAHQKLQDHYQAQQAALKKFAQANKRTLEERNAKAQTLTNIASKANENDCINAVMPDAVIRLHSPGS